MLPLPGEHFWGSVGGFVATKTKSLATVTDEGIRSPDWPMSLSSVAFQGSIPHPLTQTLAAAETFAPALLFSWPALGLSSDLVTSFEEFSLALPLLL